jgi:regulator of sirC expression with transglutaminase-like and TPR domain
MSTRDRDWAEAHVAALAETDGARLDLAEAALALAALDRDVLLAPYRRHLAQLASEFDLALRESGDKLRDGLDALASVLVERHGYEGDRDSYDDLDNADLTRVIDRRRGLPVTLGILWLHTARSAGWDGHGLAFPGHFLIRLAQPGGDSALLDPFAAGRRLGTSELRALLKVTAGPQAELTAEHYAAVDDRAVLLRLQNNIKTRLVEAGETVRAADIVRRMARIAPDQPDLWFELATLCAETGQMQDAIAAAERHLQLAPAAVRGKAGALLQQFKQRLN